MFGTPLAYVVLTAYTVMCGFLFFSSLSYFQTQIARTEQLGAFEVLARLNLNQEVIIPWLAVSAILLIFMIPLLTMRVFSEERSNGTIELLLTSPVSAGELVLGKYLAMLALVVCVLAITALYPCGLFLYGDPPPEILPTVAGLLALLLYGGLLAALGCFVSSLTRSQVLAAVVAVIASFLLYVANAIEGQTIPEWIIAVVRYMSTGTHLASGVTGRVYSEDIAYFVGGTGLLLFLARQSVESLRFR